MFRKLLCSSRINMLSDILRINHTIKYLLLLHSPPPQLHRWHLPVRYSRHRIHLCLIQFVRVSRVACSNRMMILFTVILFLAPIRPAGVKSVASFPPREESSATLPVPSSNQPAARTTPTPDDSSSTIDDDTNNLEDDELMAYDQQQASVHGERIILLRRRIRQVNSV